MHLATLGAAGNAPYAIIGMPRAHARKGSAVRPDWRSCEVLGVNERSCVVGRRSIQRGCVSVLKEHDVCILIRLSSGEGDAIS